MLRTCGCAWDLRLCLGPVIMLWVCGALPQASSLCGANLLRSPQALARVFITPLFLCTAFA